MNFPPKISYANKYTKERAEAEQRNKKILDQVKKITYRPLLTILQEMDQTLLKTAIEDESFVKNFYPNCKDEEIAAYLKAL